MRSLTVSCAALLAALSLLAVPDVAGGQEPGDLTRSLSPYFFVEGGDASREAFPLKATQVDVRIAGVIADVQVTQQYRNEGTRPLEARYVFPASTRAAVSGMQMRVGDRLIEARIREKAQARSEYAAAKREGKSASLLEQHRPNVFQMHVANILPGDDIAVTLRYTETLTPADGRYQFVFPTVVGPRYNGLGESGVAEPWVAQPTLRAGTPSPATVAIRVGLEAPIAIQDVRSPSHPITPEWRGERQVAVALDPDAGHGTRDFILDYQLAGEQIASGILLARGPEENFFLAMIEPPDRVAPADIPPREYVYVLDVSGSMHGFPLDTAKRLLVTLLDGLRPTDRFNVVLFAGSSAVLAPRSLPATPQHIGRALGLIERQRGGGGTEILPALRRAMALPPEDGWARTVVIVTDGYVAVEQHAFDLIRAHLGQASVFTFGIGTAVNRFLVEGLARAGKGEAFVVSRAEDAAAAAERFRRYISTPVWTGLRLTIDGLDAYDVDPLPLPDLFTSRPVVLLGKWRGAPQGSITVEGHTGAGLMRRTLPIGPEAVSEGAGALRYLWARTRIAALTDANAAAPDAERVREVTALGLRYSLLTDYTAFVAVDRVVRNSSPGALDTVDQPQPLPDGVSELAVGDAAPSTPEPEFYALLALASAIAWWASRRVCHAS